MLILDVREILSTGALIYEAVRSAHARPSSRPAGAPPPFPVSKRPTTPMSEDTPEMSCDPVKLKPHCPHLSPLAIPGSAATIPAHRSAGRHVRPAGWGPRAAAPAQLAVAPAASRAGSDGGGGSERDRRPRSAPDGPVRRPAGSSIVDARRAFS